MPRNIEIKAHIENVQALIPIAAAISSDGPIEILQDDTFFACHNGRLKLRAFSETEGELIFYQRANQQGPRESSYVRSSTTSPASLREMLTQAYGQTGRVQKRRTLFLTGRTRIHLDEVKDLGHFLELEVVLAEGESADLGVEEAHCLMTKLGVEPSQLVEEAYVDLVVKRICGGNEVGSG